MSKTIFPRSLQVVITIITWSTAFWAAAAGSIIWNSYRQRVGHPQTCKRYLTVERTILQILHPLPLSFSYIKNLFEDTISIRNEYLNKLSLLVNLTLAHKYLSSVTGCFQDLCLIRSLKCESSSKKGLVTCVSIVFSITSPSMAYMSGHPPPVLQYNEAPLDRAAPDNCSHPAPRRRRSRTAV